MRKKFGAVVCALTCAVSLCAPMLVNAKTLGEANLTEATRGYGGLGNQDRGRTEDSISVRVSVGGGDSDWETGNFYNYYVYRTSDGKTMDQYEISFGDKDNDGDIDMTDLFMELENYKDISGCNLSYSSGEYGDFYEDVFGISTGGSLTYKLNNIFCDAGTPDLYDGDSVVILLMTGDSNQWSEIDDSIYETVEPEYDPNNVELNWFKESDILKDDSAKTGYSKYIEQMKDNLQSSFTEEVALSDGNCFWQEMRVLRNNNSNDEVYRDKLILFEKYHVAKQEEAASGKLKAVNAMRDASVTGDSKMLDYLAHGYNGKDAFTYDKTAGMYAVDYILMCLDNENYAKDELMADNLSDYEKSPSVRDDLINYIVNTDGCFGGSFFTYDTGAQNVQAIIPYYDMYPEVRNRVDTFLEAAVSKFREDKNNPSTFDASSSSEVSRALCLMYLQTGDELYKNQALELYNYVLDMGLNNTKFKGNAMDVWRMALNEWGLNSILSEEIDLAVEVKSNVLEMFYETTTLGENMAMHLRSNEEINDISLYELELTIPSELTLVNVTSPLVDEVEYYKQGDSLRIVLANLGNTLHFTKSKDIVQINFKTKSAGKVQCEVVSSVGYADSENKKLLGVKNSSIDVLAPFSIQASVLYTGAKTSRFIDADSAVWKITFGAKVDVDENIVIHLGDKCYDMYELSDLTTDSASVYVAYLPQDITSKELTTVDSYEVVKDSEKKSITMGDVDSNGVIDVMDALHVIRIWVGKETIEDNGTLICSNVDGDRDITNADTLAIVENKVNNKEFKVLH